MAADSQSYEVKCCDGTAKSGACTIPTIAGSKIGQDEAKRKQGGQVKTTSAILLATVVGLLQACAPRGSYVGPVSDFAAAQAKLGTAVKADVDMAATTDRIAHVRRQVFTVAEQTSSTRPNVVLRAPREFLCQGIVSQELMAFDQGYIAATATNMNAIAQPPPEKFEDLVKQLGERYQIRVDKEFKARDETQKCARLYDSSDKWIARYPRSGPGVESPAAVIAAAEALYKFIAAVGQIILTEVDDARRARAFAEFFGNKENTDNLREYIGRLQKVLSTSAFN
jgi:hypothetical protein